MAVYKRGGVWWYEFVFNAIRVRESTKQGSRRVAAQMEAAHKTALAKGEVGIREKKPVPTLAEFAPRFEKAIELHCAEKHRTVDFYKAKLKTLVADETLASTPLDTLDEAAIEAYKRTEAISFRGANGHSRRDQSTVNWPLCADFCALPMNGS